MVFGVLLLLTIYPASNAGESIVERERKDRYIHYIILTETVYYNNNIEASQANTRGTIAIDQTTWKYSISPRLSPTGADLFVAFFDT